MRAMRATFTTIRPRFMLVGMPIARPAHARSAVTPDDIERERAELSDLIARRYPRAVRDLLTIGARVSRHNLRAAELGLAPIAAAEPIAVASAAWDAIGRLYPAPPSARLGAGPRAGRARTR